MKIISREEAIKKGLKKYFTGIPCKHGHISERFVLQNKCVVCKHESGRKHASTEKFKINNSRYQKSKKGRATRKVYMLTEVGKKMKKTADKKYKQSEKGKISRKRHDQSKKGRATKSAWRKTEKFKAWSKKYYKVWRKKNVKKSSGYTRKYVNSKPQAKLALKLRTRMRAALRNQGGEKSKKTMKLIGCTINYLKQHLEKQFQKGMNWENHTKHGWHIDHIIPINKFDLTDPEQQTICFNYTNLQPLWAIENLKKGAR